MKAVSKNYAMTTGTADTEACSIIVGRECRGGGGDNKEHGGGDEKGDGLGAEHLFLVAKKLSQN